MNLVNFYAIQTNIAVPKPDCKEKIKPQKTGICISFFLDLLSQIYIY